MQNNTTATLRQNFGKLTFDYRGRFKSDSENKNLKTNNCFQPT